VQRLRTPEQRFVGLPDFSYRAHYAYVADPTGGEALRMAYLDEGPSNGLVVVLLHGEPTWSYLYRFMIPGLVEAGYRVVAPDLIGFGQSDKPSQRDDHTYVRHVEWVNELLLHHLELRDVTLFAQDWGSLIGLRLVGEYPERFARVALSNGGLPTGDEAPSDAFLAWQAFSQTSREFAIGRIVSGGCVNRLADDVVAAYDAPFPDDTYKEGPRVFPQLVPTAPDDPASEACRAAWTTLRSFTKPFLLCFSNGDPITRGGERKFLREVPGTKGQAHTSIEEAGHFVQEEKGRELAAILCTFLGVT
jgi:haloalkane dehalogenase